MGDPFPWPWIIAMLIVNIALSGIVAYVAEQKGRKGSDFFWLSFLFSFIVGILVVLALPPKNEIQISKHSDRVMTKNGAQHIKCPECAEWIKAEALVCKHCGREVGSKLQIIQSEIAQAEEKEQLQQIAKETARQEKIRYEQLVRIQKRKDFLRSKRGIALISFSTLAVFSLIGVMSLQSVNSIKQETVKKNETTELCQQVNSNTETFVNFAAQIQPVVGPLDDQGISSLAHDPARRTSLETAFNTNLPELFPTSQQLISNTATPEFNSNLMRGVVYNQVVEDTTQPKKTIVKMEVQDYENVLLAFAVICGGDTSDLVFEADQYIEQIASAVPIIWQCKQYGFHDASRLREMCS